MVHAEIAHRMRTERHTQGKRKQETGQFHYNSAYEFMRRVVTYQDIPLTGELQVPIGTVITPSARDLAAERGVKIVLLPEDHIQTFASPDTTFPIPADHRRFQLNSHLPPRL